MRGRVVRFDLERMAVPAPAGDTQPRAFLRDAGRSGAGYVSARVGHIISTGFPAQLAGQKTGG